MSEQLATICVRSAIISDAAAIARIHVRAWQVAHTGIVPAEHLESLSVEQRAARWERILREGITDTLVYDDGEVRGWINWGASRDASGSEEMEIWAIYIAPEYWRGGIGNSLLSAAEKLMRARGTSTCVLWVLERNVRARRFYEKAGMTLDHAHKDIEIGGAILSEVRYRKRIDQPA